MYLSAQRHLYNSAWKSESEKKESEEVQLNEKIRSLFPEMFKTDNLNYITISFEVGYWRKANQIHKWFVEECQEGNDDCKDYWVSRDQLKELLELCKEVLKESKLVDGSVGNGYKIEKGKKIPILEAGKTIENSSTAQCLLPTQSGFFFGSEDYDEYYIRDVERTVEIIERCLKLPEEWDFEYHSSW